MNLIFCTNIENVFFLFHPGTIFSVNEFIFGTQSQVQEGCGQSQGLYTISPSIQKRRKRLSK